MRITCPACESKSIKTIESISMVEIAKCWGLIEPEAGMSILSHLEMQKIPDNAAISKCNSCGLEFGNPSFAVDNEWYKRFEKYGYRWEYKQCLDDLGNKQLNILEVGCGEGFFLEVASKAGHSILGIDFNQDAISVAKSKNLEAYSSDLQVMANMGKKFDAVVFFHVIEHLDDPELFFADLSKLTSVGSTLYFSCPCPNRWTTHLEKDKRVGIRDVWDYPPFHQSRWNKIASDEILSRFGWKLQKYVEEPFHWMGIASYLVNKNLKFSDRRSIERKIILLSKMLEIFIPSLIYKGMSMYCMAKRII